MPKGALQHWGTTRSEEGRSIDDGELGGVELTERARRGGDGSGFVIDGSAPMVGLRREANGDAGGVMHGRFDMERERERAKKELATQRRGLPFKSAEKEMGRGVPAGGAVAAITGEGGGRG
jgi:hypothetical protein